MAERPSLHGQEIRSIRVEGVELWHSDLVTLFEHRFRLKLGGVTWFCRQGRLSAAICSRQLGAV